LAINQSKAEFKLVHYIHATGIVNGLSANCKSESPDLIEQCHCPPFFSNRSKLFSFFPDKGKGHGNDFNSQDATQLRGRETHDN